MDLPWMKQVYKEERLVNNKWEQVFSYTNLDNQDVFTTSFKFKGHRVNARITGIKKYYAIPLIPDFLKPMYNTVEEYIKIEFSEPVNNVSVMYYNFTRNLKHSWDKFEDVELEKLLKVK